MFIADSDLNHKVLFSEMLAAKNIGDKVNILEILRNMIDLINPLCYVQAS